MTFQEKLDKEVEKHNSLLCVGLDPVADKLQQSFFEFNKKIIDQTAEYVCAFKPNSAFYEALGSEGIEELKKTCEYLQTSYPEIPIILDAKRGDIESTNNGYVTYAFDYLGVDAITVQSYLGNQAMKPFLDRKDKGIIVLCKTSNKGSDEFQNLKLGEKELYKHVAETVVKDWNYNGNCLMVVGATYPAELTQVRAIAGDMTFLIPGIGAQGGDVEQTVKTGINSKKAGMIISSSRGVIFAESPQSEAQKLRDTINSFR